MKRIDFFGAPASGKSAIYRRLQQDNQRKWLTPAEAHNIIIPKHVRQRSEYRLKMLLYRTTPASTALNAKIRKSMIQDAGREQVMDGAWEDFLRFLIASLPENILHPGTRFEMMERMLYWIYEVLPVVSFSSGDKICYDWSLSQRALDREFFEITRNSEFARRFFSVLPPPEMVIHTYAPAGTIVERIYARKPAQHNPEHREADRSRITERTQQSLNIAETGCEVLHQRGVPVMSVNTEEPFEQVCDTVEAAIRSV